ncbi:hypothetical protein BGZ93_003280 [Podila epicladia]|nr:hypothetical protein BGZ92_004629 [Podila epicladia]KAG0079087.1 hypothetical protein BGZ93_003280 [Podila epicladia]
MSLSFATTKSEISKRSPSAALEPTIAVKIRKYHFHPYFFQNNTKSRESAAAIFSKLNEPNNQGYVTDVSQDVPGGNHPDSFGPHVTGSFEVWCAVEGFATLSWFTLNRRKHSVLSRPLTKKQLLDQTNRAVDGLVAYT